MAEKQKENRITMHDLPLPNRPRERLQKFGSENLTDQELLAAILGSGTKDNQIIDLVKSLFEKYRDIKGIAGASLNDLMGFKGIGEAKACQIKASLELANRWDKSSYTRGRVNIRTPEDAYRALKGKSRGEQKEHFWAILLDVRNNIIDTVEISKGSLDTSIVHPRELFKEAIKASASSIIVAHNHPSGIPDASQDDIKLSKRLKEAGELVGIEIVDHIILGDGRYISLKREGIF
jgi:DNA repair protein RadC